MASSSEAGSFYAGLEDLFEPFSTVAYPLSGRPDKGVTAYTCECAPFTVKNDRYGACQITLLSPPNEDTAKKVGDRLSKFFSKHCYDGQFNSLWINVPNPVSLSVLGKIAPDFQAGDAPRSDVVHDSQTNQTRCWKWISKKECSIPPGATHNIGGTAVVVDKAANTVLLVVNQGRPRWNLPGGSYSREDKGQPLWTTALREAREESGVEFDLVEDETPTLVGQLSFPGNQLAPAINQTWSLSVQPGTSDIPLNPPEDEIKIAQWFTHREITESGDTLSEYPIGEEVKLAVKAAFERQGLSLAKDKSFMSVFSPTRTLSTKAT
ncbi:MAG: hypothetical protein S4CHLAM6_02350 [Chlamydiae bacterium]|nr:hypothetical protein [Chlamydiota bacterium]